MDIPEYISRAQTAIRDGELQMAEQYLKQVLSYNSENEDALRGLKDLEVARAKKSWTIVTRVVKLGLAMMAVKTGKAEKALPDLEILRRLQPENRTIILTYAKALHKLGRLEKAHEAFQDALRLNATDVKTLQTDADILMKLDRLDEAVKQLERLKVLRPNDDLIIHKIRDIAAKSYARTGIPENLKERRAQMEKEKRSLPGTPEFMETLDKMLAEYKKNPDKRELGIQIAAHYREGKLYGEANQVLGPILDKDHNFAPAKREQARVWRHSGELALAVQLYEEMVQSSPEDLELKDEYLDALIAQLRRQQQKNPGDHSVALKLEPLRIEREKNQIVLLRQYLENHPEAMQQRSELGEMLLRHGQVDEAITILQRMMQNRAWAGRGLFLLGQCFRAKGDNNLAAVQYEKALSYFKDKGYSHIPTDELKSVYYYLGIAREELGDIAAAREAYGQVYSVDIHFMDIRERYEKTFQDK